MNDDPAASTPEATQAPLGNPGFDELRVGDAVRVSATVRSLQLQQHRIELQCEIRSQGGAFLLADTVTLALPSPRPRLAEAPPLQRSRPDCARAFRALLASAAGLPALRCAVVHPCDAESLKGALEAAAQGFIVPVLVAPAARLRTLAQAIGLAVDGIEIVDVPHSAAAAERAAAMAAAGEVALIMKGSLHTDELMHPILARPALRTARRLSHVFHLDAPMYHKPLLISDAAINIAPTLLEKVDIVQNAIELAHALGIGAPRVALLAAVETVTPKLISTLDAAALCKMAERGQITGAVLDGPLAFDNAISPAAARTKGLVSSVAGCADILIVPDMESGNMLAKQLEYLAGAASCGLVMGASVPIALTSRADNAASRVASAALALILAHYRLRPQP